MQFFDNLYEIFIQPEELFRKLNDENNSPRLMYAIITISIVNIVFFTLKYEFSSESAGGYLPLLIMSCLWGVVLLYIIGGFFNFLMKTFGKDGKMKQIMCALSYCAFPLVLFAPIQLLKQFGQTGYFFSVVFEACIYFWSIYLMAKSIEITYDLSFSRAVTVILLPVICSFISLFWLIEFISKMVYIFKI